jgi:hypothetical protein
MVIRAKEQCPFCSIPIESYMEFVKHMENKHQNEYFMITYDKGAIEIHKSEKEMGVRKIQNHKS